MSTNDPKESIRLLVRFIANKMKTCRKLIFQSDFDFGGYDVPFALMIERTYVENTTEFSVRIIDADWQFFRDSVYTNLTDTHPDRIGLRSWITSDEYGGEIFDPKDQTTDPYEYFDQMFKHYGSTTPYLYSGIDLCDEIEKVLLREYCVDQCSSGVDEDNDKYVTIGGFIVCKEMLEGFNPSRIMPKAFMMRTSPKIIVGEHRRYGSSTFIPSEK